MNVRPIDTTYQKPVMVSAVTNDKEQKKPEGDSKVSKLNAEIEQAETKIKETMKEVQKATAESIGGSSEKAQLLQNKILMQQQTIIMKQMQVNEIESPQKPITEAAPTDTTTHSRFDQLSLNEDQAKEPDNVYRLEEQDGTQKIIFKRPED